MTSLHAHTSTCFHSLCQPGRGRIVEDGQADHGGQGVSKHGTHLQHSVQLSVYRPFRGEHTLSEGRQIMAAMQHVPHRAHVLLTCDLCSVSVLAYLVRGLATHHDHRACATCLLVTFGFRFRNFVPRCRRAGPSWRPRSVGNHIVQFRSTCDLDLFVCSRTLSEGRPIMAAMELAGAPSHGLESSAG